MEGKRQIRKKVVLQGDAACDGQVSFIEIRVCLQIELLSAGDRVEIKIPDAFLVQCKILEMNARIHCGLLGSAAGLHGKISDAISRKAACLQTRKTSEIEVASGKIQVKLISRKLEVL